jgi:hypothetical protein
MRVFHIKVQLGNKQKINSIFAKIIYAKTMHFFCEDRRNSGTIKEMFLLMTLTVI